MTGLLPSVNGAWGNEMTHLIVTSSGYDYAELWLSRCIGW